MSDFADSEQRLKSALERIDYFISRAKTPGPDHGLQSRLDAALAENKALWRENEALNDRLRQSDEGGLRAELDALKATRAAEIAALDEIMSGLERLMATAPRASDAPYAGDVRPDSGDVVAFSGQKGKG
ncbi:MAG: hypothetical protein Q4G36_00590 [Paracoccus sp. (in: a-proteobacteria)]|nr:hypothetical protein [Paracoccus sp. (in: a-proteobacteria)]